ncbi:MAG: polyprenyl synthetase family protein [Nitrospinaceae bacterium]
MDFKDVNTLFKDDLSRVDKCLRDNYFSDIPLVPGIGDYIMNGGGKRIRPLLLLMSTRLFGREVDDRVIRHATAVEYVHAATLLHDDVVDETTVRRGQATVNAKWGSDASILVGDFLIARALLLLSKDVHEGIFQAFAEGAKSLVEGGLLEISYARDIQVTEAHCLDVARRKTASIMALSCRLGAQLAAATPSRENGVADFGMNFGIAFQLIDDALDYDGTPEQLGKPAGTDFKEGHVTLPLHFLYHAADSNLKREIESFIMNEALTQKDLDYIVERMREAKAIEYTLTLARNYMDRAKQSLTGAGFMDSPIRQTLFATADHILNRIQPRRPSLVSSRY